MQAKLAKSVKPTAGTDPAKGHRSLGLKNAPTTEQHMTQINNDYRSQQYENGVDTATVTAAVQQGRSPGSDQSNSVGQHGGGAQQTGNSPSAGSREAVAARHRDIEETIDERLMEDPEYRDAKAEAELLGKIQGGFGQIDGFQGWRNDSIVELWDLEEIVKNASAPAAAREAAQLLLDNPGLWRKLATKVENDNRVSLKDLADVLSEARNKVKSLKDGIRDEVKAELGVQTNGQAATGGTPATGADASKAAKDAQAAKDAEAAKRSEEAQKVLAEAEKSLPKPAPSKYSGLEGASENLNNMVGWGESEIDRLTSLMSKTDDPAALKALENKVNQMSRRMQQMTALLNQIMTMMQNISKMYSDIAMNAVRNMR